MPVERAIALPNPAFAARRGRRLRLAGAAFAGEGPAGELFRGERDLPLPGTGVRGAAVLARRALGRRVAPDRVGGSHLRAVAPALAIVQRTRRPEKRLLVWWGIVLAVMNSTFYVAIDRLPLGTSPRSSSSPSSRWRPSGRRSSRNVVALALAVVGVYLLTDVRFAGEPIGFLFAFANAGLFALYIVLGHRVAAAAPPPASTGSPRPCSSRWSSRRRSAFGQRLRRSETPVAMLAGVGVGITSSVIPYVTDQMAMSRVKRSTYALLVSLLPATATVVGIVVLAQIPSAIEVVGVTLVVGAVAVHREREAR